jgi:hypothetical protein
MSMGISGIGGSYAPQAMSGASARMPPTQKMATLFSQIDTSGTGLITFPDDEANCWLSRHGGRRSISGSKSEQFRNGLATKLRPRHDKIDDAIPLSGKFRELERFPPHGNCVIEKKSLRFKELEHVLIEKFEQLFRDMLQDRLISLYERIEPPSFPVDST